jgi:hypothetical protein
MLIKDDSDDDSDGGHGFTLQPIPVRATPPAQIRR